MLQTSIQIQNTLGSVSAAASASVKLNETLTFVTKQLNIQRFLTDRQQKNNTCSLVQCQYQCRRLLLITSPFHTVSIRIHINIKHQSRSMTVYVPVTFMSQYDVSSGDKTVFCLPGPATA